MTLEGQFTFEVFAKGVWAMNTNISVKRIFLNIGLLGIVICLMYTSALPTGGLELQYQSDPFWGFLVPLLFMLIPSLLLVFFFRSAFKGYREEFLLRYPKAVNSTVVIEAGVWIFSLIYTTINNHKDRSGDLMPGMNALGEVIFTWFIWAVAVLALIVIWTAAFISFMRKRKQALE